MDELSLPPGARSGAGSAGQSAHPPGCGGSLSRSTACTSPSMGAGCWRFAATTTWACPSIPRWSGRRPRRSPPRRGCHDLALVCSHSAEHEGLGRRWRPSWARKPAVYFHSGYGNAGIVSALIGRTTWSSLTR